METGKRPIGWPLLVALTNGRTRIPDDRLAASVRGKVVLVTGSSYGIGEATAKRLARAGATVLLLARTAEQLEIVAEEIQADGGKAFAYPANLADPASIEAVVAKVLAEHGQVDVLVSNAGKSIRRSIADSYQRFHDIERTNAVNYLGPAKLVLELLPSMRERGSGHIVNVSTAGVRTPPMARWSAYLASKTAFDMWLRCVSQEVRDDGVTTSTIYMGPRPHPDELADAATEPSARVEPGAGRRPGLRGGGEQAAQHHTSPGPPGRCLWQPLPGADRPALRAVLPAVEPATQGGEVTTAVEAGR